MSLIKLEKVSNLSISNADKIAHFGIYFVFTIVWYACFINERAVYKTNLRNLIMAALLAFVVGVAIEILQHLNPLARSGDVKDALANTLGIVLAMLVLRNSKINDALKSKK